MKIFNLYISRKDGINFEQNSGDTNKIHTDYLTGYNSIYGNNIVHGCNLVIKILKKLKLKKFKKISIKFYEGVFYDLKIKIKKKESTKFSQTWEIYQDKIKKGIIEIYFSNSNFPDVVFKKISYKKKFIITSKDKNKYANLDSQLNLSLKYLSKYVGVHFPGERSIISEIDIFNSKFLNNNISVESFKPSSRYPLIYNKLLFKKLKILFKTFVRPVLKINKNKINKKIIKKFNNIKENILIIGASNGIGKELANLFSTNKKIKKIYTYNQNLITSEEKNTIIKKINIERDLKKLFSIIKFNKPISVYYFATPKINQKAIGLNTKKLYKYYYIDIPLRLIKYCKKHNSNFFYPSTTYVNEKKINIYCLTKKEAEKKITTIKDYKSFVKILRIPEINTKQNLSILTNKLPSFSELLKNKKMLDKVLFNS